MRRYGVVVLALLLPIGATQAQGLRENTLRSLFSDQKAAAPGDAISILVVEQSSATNDAQTQSSRGSDISLGSSGAVGSSSIPSVGLNVATGNSFKGEGATASRGSVRARLGAHVDSVLANGNLAVSGTRLIVVNGEEQTIRITGIVRPSDIMADNTIYSYNIANAQIIFEGSGIVSHAQGPGWITKLLHWLF